MLFIWKELPADEQELVLDELWERLKDIAFMHGKDRLRLALDGMHTILDENDIVTIGITVEFLITDVMQIVGRKRRPMDES